MDLAPATPEGDDERSKDTQSISMQIGQQDLVEGERMSGQDVRTHTNADRYSARKRNVQHDLVPSRI